MADSKQTEAQDASIRPTVVPVADLDLLQGYVARLAQFLARPDSLQQAIRDRYTVTGALPEEWQTLLELMPKTGSVLQVSGERGKWLVGFHSAAPSAAGTGATSKREATIVQAAPPAQEVQAKEEAKLEALEPTERRSEVVPEATEVAEDQSEPPYAIFNSDSASSATLAEESSGVDEPDTEPNIERDVSSRRTLSEFRQAQVSLESISTVEAIDQKIRSRTEERLNLGRVALELRLLEISPPFEAFKSSAKSVAEVLRRLPPGVPEPIHIQIVSQYQENLKRGWGGMLKSFYLAAVLTSSDGGGMSPRSLTTTLRFLSSELDFASLSTEQINNLLDNLASGSRRKSLSKSETETMIDSLSSLPIDLTFLDVVFAEAGKTAKGLISLEDKPFVSACYRDRAHSLILHMRSGNRLPLIGLIELRLLYAGKVTRFSGDPNTLSLADYARALRGADSAGAEGFIMTVFLKLGFANYVRKTLQKSDMRAQIDPSLWDDIVEQAEFSQEPSLHALIVTDELLKWFPSTELAVVQLDSELVFRLETPHVMVCMTGRDIDGEKTIRLRKLLPGVKFFPLDHDADRVENAIPRGLFDQPEDKKLLPTRPASA